MKLSGVSRSVTGWLAQHRQTILIVFAVLVAIEVTGQLVYPHHKALPLAQLRASPVGGHDRSQIVQRIQQDFYQADATIELAGQSHTVSLARLGATVNADAMAAELTDYSIAERLLPLSIFFHRPEVTSFEVDFSNRQLDEQISDVAAKLSFSPVDAGLAIDDGELVVTKSKNGRQVEVEQLKSNVISTKYQRIHTTIKSPSSVKKPQLSDASIASVRDEAESILARPIEIRVSDNSQLIQPARQEIAKLLKIENSPDQQTLKLNVNKQAVADYAEAVWRQSKVDPEVTTVKLVDGKEDARDLGQPGLGIDRQLLADDLAVSLLDGQPTGIYLQYQRQPIDSPISYQRTYTSSQRGLSAYVSQLTADGNIKLAVRQLGGTGWQATGGANDSIPSASTYKLYVMLRVFSEIDSQKMSWNSRILDTNAATCFERIIVVSSNPCAEEWLRKFGRSATNSFLRAKGFSAGTVFPDNGAARTTVADLSKFLVQLENSSLVSGQHRTMLLEKMNRQIYRQGVPSGTDAKVYDKVGFLWDYVHDAAIVRHPKGTYVIVVMTKGASYQRIAEITKQVERILYK